MESQFDQAVKIGEALMAEMREELGESADLERVLPYLRVAAEAEEIAGFFDHIMNQVIPRTFLNGLLGNNDANPLEIVAKECMMNGFILGLCLQRATDAAKPSPDYEFIGIHVSSELAHAHDLDAIWPKEDAEKIVASVPVGTEFWAGVKAGEMRKG